MKSKMKNVVLAAKELNRPTHPITFSLLLIFYPFFFNSPLSIQLGSREKMMICKEKK